MIDKITRSFNVYIICRAIENIVMTIGIVFASVYFEKMALLWFLLIPALNQVGFKSQSKEDNNGRL